MASSSRRYFSSPLQAPHSDPTRAEPRVKIAIPILGLPFEAFHSYVTARAVAAGLPPGPPTYPTSLHGLLETPVPPGAYKGKKILSIHGEDDELVPYCQGEEEINAMMDQVEGPKLWTVEDAGIAYKKGDIEIWTYPETGHMVTVEMVMQTAEWIWRWALSGDEVTVDPVLSSTT